MSALWRVIKNAWSDFLAALDKGNPDRWWSQR
jgi:hypothetical protein